MSNVFGPENTSRSVSDDPQIEYRGGYQPRNQKGSPRPTPPAGGTQSSTNNGNKK